MAGEAALCGVEKGVASISTASSAAEARELWQLLQQIDGKVTELEAKEGTLKDLTVSVSELVLLMNQASSIARQLGLPEDAGQLLAAVQRTIVVINQFRTALLLLEMQMGPIGWLLMGLGVASSTMSTLATVGSFG